MNNITGALYRVIKIKWGVSTNPWGSFLLSPFPLKPGGCCAKVGGINPGVCKTPWVCLMFHSTHNKPLLLFSSIFRGMVKTATRIFITNDKTVIGCFLSKSALNK